MVMEKTRITAQEYAQLPETSTPMQLLDGEIIVSPSPRRVHQETVGASHLLLAELTKPLGGYLYIAPMDVYLDDENIPQPDLFWLAPDTVARRGEMRIEGPPDLIIEVLSPASVKLDRVKKYNLYEKYGVREYWILDPIGVVDVFTHKDGHFELVGIYDSEDTFSSPLLGQPVEVKRLFL
jgi:Uma2 family endonuclease